jgi:hypothetical protein
MIPLQMPDIRRVPDNWPVVHPLHRVYTPSRAIAIRTLNTDCGLATRSQIPRTRKVLFLRAERQLNLCEQDLCDSDFCRKISDICGDRCVATVAETHTSQRSYSTSAERLRIS